MKIIVSGAPLPAEVAEKFPNVTYAPCIDNQLAVDPQGWHTPHILSESCATVLNGLAGPNAIVDQEGILQRALGVIAGYGQWQDGDPRDVERMVWCARQVINQCKKFYPHFKWSHWCSLVNPPYLYGRVATSDDIVQASEITRPLREACDILEFSVYPYDPELSAGAWINIPWIKSSTQAALRLGPQRTVMATITNRDVKMKRYSRGFMTDIVKAIRGEYNLEAGRKDRVDIINLWWCDPYLQQIALHQIPDFAEWWPGMEQGCIDELGQPDSPTPAQIIAEDLQTIVEALA